MMIEIPEAVSYPDLNIDTRVIDGRLFVDSEQLASHVTLAAYNMNLVLRQQQIDDPIMWAGVETMRNLALVLWDSHDLTVARDENMFAQGLDNLLDND